MLVLPQKVVVKWNVGNKKWYMEKGYNFTKIKDEFEVDVLDLPLKSHQHVEVTCDYCGESISKKYGDYNRPDKKREDCCRKCATQKIADKKRTPIEEVKNIFEKSNCTLLATEYTSNLQKLKFICKCGNEDEITLQSFKAGQRCNQCRKNKQYDTCTVKNLFLENGCVLLEDNYISAHIVMHYICVCGEPSKISLHSFLKGSRCKQCGIEKRKGENSPNWNPDLTEEDREIGRKTGEYYEWRKQILRRDNYTCRCCGKRGGSDLRVHHKDGYHWCIEKRLDMTNGVVLCAKCHDSQYEGSFHSVYGNKNNTEEQFNRWIESKLIDKGVII